MPATTLWLARHGEIRGVGELFYGHHDVPLSPRGVREALAVAERLRARPLRAVYSSDLERTRVMAQLIAAPHGLAVSELPALREMALGALEGLPVAVARERYPSLASRSIEDMADFRFPEGGESMRDVAERALPVFAELFERHRGEAFCVVGHNSVNRILLADVLGLSIERMFRFGQPYGALSEVRYTRRGREVVQLGEPPALAVLDAGPTSALRVPRCEGIYLERIRFEGRHGWHAAEREQVRPFQADVWAETSLRPAGRSDELADTIDYRVLARRVVELGSQQSFRLIEALGAAIADDLMAHVPALESVEVTVYKAVQLAGDVREVAVRVVRRRGGS